MSTEFVGHRSRFSGWTAELRWDDRLVILPVLQTGYTKEGDQFCTRKFFVDYAPRIATAKYRQFVRALKNPHGLAIVQHGQGGRAEDDSAWHRGNYVGVYYMSTPLITDGGHITLDILQRLGSFSAILPSQISREKIEVAD